VVVAPSTDEAIALMREQRPDLILTSALIMPGDDWSLTEHLRLLPRDRQVPVLTVPPVIDLEEHAGSENRRRGLLSFFGRGRKPRLWQSYDQEAVGLRVKEALEEARAEVRYGAPRPDAPPRAAGPTLDDHVFQSLLRDVAAARGERPHAGSDDPLERCGLGPKRARAHRWTGTDLSWLNEVTLPWGLEVQLLNISSSGLLVQSGARFMPGSATVFKLSGPNRHLLIPAKVVRSQVATVGSMGVKYLAAATFDRTVSELGALSRPDGPGSLQDVMTTVKAAARRGARPAALRAAFEQGIHQLVTSREIRLRDVPVVQNDGSESVYFTVATRDESPVVLQATFEPNYQPRGEEFEVLRAAATLAPEVLELEAAG
jgi:CheY-like chemotaxis protein